MVSAPTFDEKEDKTSTDSILERQSYKFQVSVGWRDKRIPLFGGSYSTGRCGECEDCRRLLAAGAGGSAGGSAGGDGEGNKRA